MRKPIFTVLLSGVLITVMSLVYIAVPRVTPASAQELQSDGVSLTVYNQGTALVQDRRTFTLEQGLNTLNFTDVAASIDATSVSFNSLTDPDGTVVLEQNYVYDLVDSSALLSRYLDQQIEVTVFNGDTMETLTGQLLSGRNGEIILRKDDGQVISLSQYTARDIRFPELPAELITRPTLRWLINAEQGGDQQVELTYLTGGISWTADYIVLLAPENTSLDLNGWVTFNNTSGAAYHDAKVKLIAGDVNRLPEQEVRRDMEETDMLALATATPAGVEQREFYEYQLYEIGRPVTVGDNETKQVEFVTGANVPATTYYVYNGSPYYGGYYYPITDAGYGLSGITDVQNYLEFTTDEEDGLGADLPAGRVRVYQEDIDGSALLIGENRIDHTPEGETVSLYLGNAFDLVGERKQTEFDLISDYVMDETYEIRLRNRKDDQAVEIRVPESLFRWSDWEILYASHAYVKMDSAHIEFRVTVPPGGEEVITYTVRYSWE